MRTQKLWMLALMMLTVSVVQAHVPKHGSNAGNNKNPNTKPRAEVCANSTSQIDQDINNVRARLLAGGDCWWDLKDGRYIVPKVDPATGAPEVSALFAGSVWLGGVDPGGNLKLACQTYRNDGRNDFWPGPLNEQGTTERQVCNNWDFHFEVTGEEIREHLRNLSEGNLDRNAIPRGLRGWPAQGNQHFSDVWGFDLPFTSQGLAGFFDKDMDGLYEPLKGDYPSIEIRGCTDENYPDEMIFWIYNDEGGGQPHAETGGDAIQMEVQVQSFGYTTNDELNDMTFQRYKLINRATERIDSMFFAMWTDPDLGCAFDDYIGCDTLRDLMVVYNQDNQDGQPGCNCDGGAPTYCNDIPLLGVDYFRGPLDENADEIGMSSFVYYNNSTPANQADPSSDLQYYNYLTGYWGDGSPFTVGGSGYGGTIPTKYVFPEEPNNAAGWSMCTATLPQGDRRTLQASGPFTLLPGAVNELIIGVPFVADVDYPCPSFQDIFRADDVAQGLFNSCFKILNGPTAPDVDWVEMNREVVAIFTNDKLSNNYKEGYSNEEIDPLAPLTVPFDKKLYKFEGYRLYQLISPDVSGADYDDPTKARIVYEVDIKNNISKIFNWRSVPDPNKDGELVFFPEQMVEGPDDGIRHTFSIKEDKFAQGNDKALVNHKKYYFSAIAYAYNNYQTFDPLVRPIQGQRRSYLPGRLNIETYTVIPRPTVDQALQSSYGEGPIITRLEGAGTGTNFVDLDDATRERILNLGTDSSLTYRPGRAPIAVTIFNPFEVVDGTYEVSIVDNTPTDTKLDGSARWELRRLPSGPVIASERSLDTLNEQIVAEYGFSVSIGQTLEPADTVRVLRDGDSNGAIGTEIEYKDPNLLWLAWWPDQKGGGFFDYVKTGKGEYDYDADGDGKPIDGNERLSTVGNGLFTPYPLCDWNERDPLIPLAPPTTPYFTPAWTHTSEALLKSVHGTEKERRGRLALLPNVDIVMTSDKSKWSRCVVIETASMFYTNATDYLLDPDLVTESPANRKRLAFDVRYSLSVGKDDANKDGRPDPDGAVNPSGTGIPASQVGAPVYGMGWFPGYAVDVETGRRLNIFFGENSVYDSKLDTNFTGRDMLFNPTTQVVRPGSFGENYNWILGGQHYVYVTNTAYDECEAIRRRFTPEFATNQAGDGPSTFKNTRIRDLAWAGLIQLPFQTVDPAAKVFKMPALGNGPTGLIPNDVRIKLRVDNIYQPWYGDDGKKTAYPKYQFKLENKESIRLTDVQINNALDSVKVVPNPYYGYSQYEVNQFSNVVKITNLPGKCKVTIYSMDGKFIRQYNRDEAYSPYNQISPALEWDLKNSKGIPVASGVYLIQLQAPGMGERTIKWFGIARQFDPSGL